MRLYGLIGFPLKHSFSKQYFTEKFAKEHINDCSFENFELQKCADVKAMLQQNPTLQGFAVTIPYKKKVIHYLENATDNVKKIVACNCIKIVDGKLYGYNTDVIGFEKSLIKKLKPYHQKALILGTGGAASAVEFVLQKLGIEYFFVSRSATNKRRCIGYDDLSESIMAHHTLIINTTPLGTFPDVDTYPNIPYKYLTPKHYLFDLVYNPPTTKFLAKGTEYGATIQNGHEMLIIQAEENWKIWNEGLSQK